MKGIGTKYGHYKPYSGHVAMYKDTQRMVSGKGSINVGSKKVSSGRPSPMQSGGKSRSGGGKAPRKGQGY